MSALALRLTVFRKVKIYQPAYSIDYSKNPWVRFYYLTRPRPPGKYKQGQYVRVMKNGHALKGKVVQVHFSSHVGVVELHYRSQYFWLNDDEVKPCGIPTISDL